MSIGNNIKRILEGQSMSVYKLAKEGQVSNSYLSEIINNEKTNPSIDILLRISKVLKVPLDELIKE
ncbi:MAG: Cro/C1-type DNA-binding domain [Clostridiaceae bacterium]|jgi:transcriptional regulator with XRE-family HTH domain|nr:Cro/C1-type DNA-binding domain [Clostridiaceae bacterium]